MKAFDILCERQKSIRHEQQTKDNDIDTALVLNCAVKN